jgi:hypothetical protein
MATLREAIVQKTKEAWKQRKETRLTRAVKDLEGFKELERAWIKGNDKDDNEDDDDDDENDDNDIEHHERRSKS